MEIHPQKKTHLFNDDVEIQPEKSHLIDNMEIHREKSSVCTPEFPTMKYLYDHRSPPLGPLMAIFRFYVRYVQNVLMPYYILQINAILVIVITFHNSWSKVFKSMLNH